MPQVFHRSAAATCSLALLSGNLYIHIMQQLKCKIKNCIRLKYFNCY